MHARNVVTPTRRDKYQPNVKEYWVDTQTTGTFDDEHEEQLIDRTTGEGEAVSFDVGIPAPDPCLRIPGEESCAPETDEEIEDEADDANSIRTRQRVPSKQEVEKEHALEASWV